MDGLGKTSVVVDCIRKNIIKLAVAWYQNVSSRIVAALAYWAAGLQDLLLVLF